MVDFVSHHILSLLIFFPLLAALAILLLPSKNDCRLHRHIALLATAVEFIFSLHLIRYFVRTSSLFQFSQFLQ